ncbi:MAG TPA: SPOR domain-containing protein [Novosphingobium sp.]|nr:SPOR domain-containing protein [Novosphingobium sp.]
MALAACGAATAEPVSVQIAPSGPAADYPMVIGAPFTIDGVTYKPSDTMNYDAVGYAALGTGGGNAITGAHRTLPLPSYVEVTSLDTGKTILVRMERRGPMTNARLVELSPGAAAQLGLTGDRAPIRVRRVNPPEPERSALRLGGRAPERMETPRSLLAVLMRKLDQQNGAAPVPVGLPATLPVTVTPKPVPGATLTPVPPLRRPIPRVRPEPQAVPTPTPAPAAAAAPVRGAIVVQVAAFSTKARADGVAARLGGQVSQIRNLWRVRMGPFATQALADAALAKARTAGYSDARIQRAD